MAKLRILEIRDKLISHLQLLRRDCAHPFLFDILPGRCEITPPKREKKKKLQTEGTFFLAGVERQ